MNAEVEDAEDTLDLSWIEEECRLLQSVPMQKTPMQSIRLKCVYVSPENDIVVQQTHDCVLSVMENYSLLSWSELARYVGTKVIDYVPYSLDHLCIYHIDVDAIHLPAYLTNSDAVSLVPVSINTDLIIASALPLFHPIHELFAFFKGTTKGTTKGTVAAARPSNIRSLPNSHSTKRVRISEPVSKHTRKHI
jgi:hypothetical protein